MLITDYTITWVDINTIELAWDGGVSTARFSIFVDGILSGRMEDSGNLTFQTNVIEREAHSYAIVKHDTTVLEVPSTEDARLVRPRLRWLPVENTAVYEVYELNDNDVEFLVSVYKVADLGDANYFEYEYPADLPLFGVGQVRFKVYARGSFGTSVVNTIHGGVTCGFPPQINTIAPTVDSGGDLSLVCNT